MTRAFNADLTLFPGRRPARTGQPWTDEDHERLIELVREGRALTPIADALQRTDQAVVQRMRAVLPVDERKCPADRVLPALRGHLDREPDYPWAEIILQSPAPAPTVQHVVRHEGVAGLDDDLLVQVAYGLLRSEAAGDGHREQACEEVRNRGLVDRVTTLYRRALLRRTPPLTPHEADDAADEWFEAALGEGRPPGHLREAHFWR
jgi:hypothetical protein